jgi:hypothetical protein
MTTDEATIEEEIVRKGKTAPRLTPALIDAQIAGYVYGRASELWKDVPHSKELECLTICVMTLKNGYTLIGKSACASPENYDAEIGAKIAIDDARKQIWALEGYALRNALSGRAPFNDALR